MGNPPGKMILSQAPFSKGSINSIEQEDTPKASGSRPLKGKARSSRRKSDNYLAEGVSCGIISSQNPTRSTINAGIQIGLLYNSADTLEGVQIGLLNFAWNKKPLMFFPVINYRFK